MWVGVAYKREREMLLKKICRGLGSTTAVRGRSYDAVVIGGGHNGLIAVSLELAN